MVDFTLQEVLLTTISQVMIKSSGKGIRLTHRTSEEIMDERLYGDSARLQQILSDFLLISVNYTPNGGQLGIAVSLTKDRLGERVHLSHIDLRITHSGGGVPEELLSQMFENYTICHETETPQQPPVISNEGISLVVSRKLLRLMDGGQLGIAVSLTKDRLGERVHLAHLELRITHSGGGVPEELLSPMFENYTICHETETPQQPPVISDEGISLVVSRKLLRLMDGDVRYMREAGKSSFIISLELAASAPSKQTRVSSSTGSHC